MLHMKTGCVHTPFLSHFQRWKSSSGNCAYNSPGHSRGQNATPTSDCATHQLRSPVRHLTALTQDRTSRSGRSASRCQSPQRCRPGSCCGSCRLPDAVPTRRQMSLVGPEAGRCWQPTRRRARAGSRQADPAPAAAGPAAAAPPAGSRRWPRSSSTLPPLLPRRSAAQRAPSPPPRSERTTTRNRIRSNWISQKSSTRVVHVYTHLSHPPEPALIRL